MSLGCQEQHKKSQEAALERWNATRAKIGIDLARQKFEAGELSKAGQIVRNTLETNARYGPGHLLLGRIYLEQNRLSKARESFEQCLQIEPSNAKAEYNLAIVYERQGRLEQAFSHYERAWNNSNGHIAYLLAMSEVRLSQGKAAEALELLGEYINDSKGEVSVSVLAGNILNKLGRCSEATEMFRRAYGLETDNGAITESLAFALHRVGKADEAIVLFEKLRRKAKAQSGEMGWACLLALGDCYLQTEQFHKAQRCFEFVMKRDTSNPALWGRLAQAALGKNDLDRAGVCANKALALNADETDALLVLGYIAMQEQDYKGAESTFRQIISAEANNGLAYCLLGQSLEAAGREKEAIACYGRALKIDAQDKLAQKLMISAQTVETSNESVTDSF